MNNKSLHEYAMQSCYNVTTPYIVGTKVTYSGLNIKSTNNSR